MCAAWCLRRGLFAALRLQGFAALATFRTKSSPAGKEPLRPSSGKFEAGSESGAGGPRCTGVVLPVECHSRESTLLPVGVTRTLLKR